MKMISFAAMKGGTGKTTCCWNIGAYLAKNSKVLIMDDDPQGNCSSNLRFDVINMKPDAHTVADIYENISSNPMDVLQPAPIEELPNLDLFPSNMLLHGTEQMLATRAMREQVLMRYIKKNNAFFSYYDYILIDTAPNFGIINQNAFFASDSIILVSEPDVNSINGVHEFLELWESARQYADMEDNVNALIINNVERTKMTNKMFEYIESQPDIKKILIDSHIIHTTRFKECAEQNYPITLLKTKSHQEERSRQRAEKCIADVVKELKKKGVF